jgi:uncharacterized protein
MLAHNVASLLKTPLGTARDVEIDEPRPRLGNDVPPIGPVRGSARFMRTQDSILVRGHLSTTVELECSRCLEPFAMPVEIAFEEEFRPTVNITTGVPLEPAEDEALRIDEHHILDLTEIVRQYLLTELPLKPVCRPDCAGLCPNCGADLDQGPCACDAEPASGIFAALAPLLANERSRGPQQL